MTNAWSTGLTASITIANTDSTVVNGWSLAFTLPSGQSLVSGWNAQFSANGSTVTAKNNNYNAAIGPNASLSIGFQATHSGDTSSPTAFALNGTACSTA